MRLRKIITPIGPSISYIPLTQGQFACIDSHRLDDAGMSNWYAHFSPKSGHFYVKRKVRNPDIGKWDMQSLHNFILGYREGFTADHKEPGNGLDCREANLRHANSYNQMSNRRKYRNNKSGYKGACFNKRVGKWAAYIDFSGARVHLGYFFTKELAYEAYCKAAEIYHGEFRRIS